MVPKVVVLGSGTTEQVSRERLHFYQRLATLVANGVIDPPSGIRTIYLSTDQLGALNRSPWEILASRLADNVFLPSGSIDQLLIVDLTRNQPVLVGERVLTAVGAALGNLLAEAPRGRHVLIMLPFPVTDPESLRAQLTLEGWLRRNARRTGETYEGSALVLGSDGSGHYILPDGGYERAAIEGVNYPAELRAQNDPAGVRLRCKMLRRLGHYTPGSLTGYCSRYFYDAQFAVAEVVELTEQILTEAQPGGGLTILSHQTRSPWLDQVATLVADRLGTSHHLLPAPEAPSWAPISCNRAVLLLDVINSGATVDQLVAKLASDHVDVLPTVVAVFVDEDWFRRHPDGLGHAGSGQAYMVEAVAGPVRRDIVRREECPQCKMEVPRDEDDKFLGIRAFDWWQMVLDSPWGPEAYGPEQLPPFPCVPDFSKLFKEYGAWIGYKFQCVLDSMGLGGASRGGVVYVCPAEDAIQKLTEQLIALGDQHPVPVSIPQDVLQRARRGDLSAIDIDRNDGWQGQLKLLEREDPSAVVIIDEFNASGTTATALVEILRLFGISPAAYLPFFNRKPGFSLPGDVPVLPLYEIHSPRPAASAKLPGSG